MIRAELRDLSLLDLIPALNQRWKSPYHLTDWCDLIEGSLRGGARAMVSVPFQHYKSTTTLCGVVWLLIRNPRLRVLVMTHSKAKAIAMGKELRELWKMAGGEMRKGFDLIEDWQTAEGGGCIVMSAEQSKLGMAVDIVLVDDPLDENEYMLQDTRDRVDAAIALYTARAATHLNSVLIVASRWHPDDPIGRRVKRAAVQWLYICHAGIVDYQTPSARAFAPEVLSLEQHMQLQREWAELDPSLRSWWAQIQNNPLPDALGFFTGHHPLAVDRFVPPTIAGVDLAFTSGTKSDFAAFVVTFSVGDCLAVWDVVRHQRGLASALTTLQQLNVSYPGGRFVSYVSGAEKGIYNATYELDPTLLVEQMPARFDKGYRAQKAALSWRQGRILVRMGQPWSGPFVAECHAFDGSDKGVDDQVDALVAAHDAWQACVAFRGFGQQFTFGSPGAAG